MSTRTEYKPGDRVVVNCGKHRTVFSTVVGADTSGCYRVVRDSKCGDEQVETFHGDYLCGFTLNQEANVEFAPDSIADAFIDKVADRVAAKVKAALPTTEPAPQDGAQRVAYRGKWFDLNVAPATESRYVTATDKQSIKAALAAGKIVNAPKGSGKTTAILELLRENPGKYVAVYSDLGAELRARQHNYNLFDAYPKEHDTDNIGSTQSNGARLVIADDCPLKQFDNLFASVYTS
jgi:hypothetical protein